MFKLAYHKRFLLCWFGMDKLRDFLQSFWGRVLLLVCLSPMVFLGLESYFHSTPLNADEVAKVGETPITLSALQNEINATKNDSQMGRQALGEHALGLLIDRALLGEHARHLGLVPSDAAITAALAKDPLFLDEQGKFSNERFAQFLQSNHLTKDRLFELQRSDMSIRQLIQGLLGGAIVPKSAATRLIGFQELSRPLWIKRLAWQHYSNQVTVSDKEVADYYATHKDTLVQPERVDLSYVVFEPTAIKPTDEELKTAYTNYVKDSVATQKQLAQILLSDDSKEKEVQAKLEAGEEFADLAKRYSTDSSSQAGGDIGLYNPAVFGNDADKVGAAIAELKVGETTKAIKTKFGTHFFKVLSTPAVPSFDELKDTLTQNWLEKKQREQYDSLAAEIAQMSADGLDLKDIAKKTKLPLQQIKDYKASGQQQLANAHVADYAFDATNTGVSPAIEVNGATLWLQASNRRPKATMNLQEATEVIKELLIQQKATALAMADAQKMIAQPTLSDFDKIDEVNAQSTILIPDERASLFVKEHQGDKAAWVVQTELGASAMIGGEVAQKTSTEYANAQQMMQSVLGQDYLQDYLDYLKTVYPIERNQQALDSVF